jgi:hypothetical protein
MKESTASPHPTRTAYPKPRPTFLFGYCASILLTCFSVTIACDARVSALMRGFGGRAPENRSWIVSDEDLPVNTGILGLPRAPTPEITPLFAAPASNPSGNQSSRLAESSELYLPLVEPQSSLLGARVFEPLRLAQAVAPSFEMQFVSSAGTDSNDGRSLERPKKTIYAALQALPGGERMPPTAGHGIVWVNDSVEYGGVTQGNGIWMMGPGDSNFKNPPKGWLHYTGGVRIVCLGNANSAPDQHIPQCSISAGGNQDGRHPAVWLSSLAGGFYLDGLGFKYPQIGIRIGIDSSGDRLRGGVQNVELKNISVNLGNCQAGAGPGIDIGDSTFWIWILDSFVGGCGNSSYRIGPSPMGLTRSEGIVTIGMDASVSNISDGQIISIYNPSDPSFSGGCTVLSIPDANHLRCAQPGPNGSSGQGWVMTDQAAAVNVDPGGGSGSGLLFFRDDVFDISGPSDGIRFQNGLNGGSLDVQGQTCEGSYKVASGPCLHVYWNPRTSPVVNVNVWHVESADNNNGGNRRAPAVQVDGPFDPSAIVVSGASAGGSTNLAGPMTVLGQYVPNLNAIAESPLREGQIGFFHNHVVGSIDVARRQFGPVAVRFPNLAHTSPSAWELNRQQESLITPAARAPDGTNGAGTSSERGGPQNSVIYYKGKQKIVVGDYFVAGVWTKAKNGYNGGLSNFSLKIFGQGVRTAGVTQAAPYAGDGEWEWLFSVQKITESAVDSADISIGSTFGADQPITTYAPILIHIPAGSLSDNEVYELGYDLTSYDSSCVVGSVCGLSEQGFLMPGAIQAQFIIASEGKPLSNADVVLSHGWGRSAFVSGARGSSQRFIFAVAAKGDGVERNPKLTITFPTSWPVQPIFFCKQVGGSGPISTVSGEGAASAERMTLIFNGTPVAGSDYLFACEGQ